MRRRTPTGYDFPDDRGKERNKKMETEINAMKQNRVTFRPKLTFFHPNPKGTGCAVSMEVHPAHDDVEGSIFLSAANQLTVGDRSAQVPVT